MRGPILKHCGHCGQAFECGQYGCWCGRLGITDRQMDWIAARFEDCLCPACLEQVRAGGSRASPRSRRKNTHTKGRPTMRITKVYTRTGDAGKTRLAGGQQVWKDSLRVEAYGTVDELNASVGVVRVIIAETGGGRNHAVRLEEELRWIQNKLFDVGGLLATAPGQTFKNTPQVTGKDVVRLEKLIDRCQEDLAPLKEFILPGGGKVSGFLHQARTICRRAERLCVRLARKEPVDPSIIKFVNRLSDALFVLARWAAKTQGEPEFLWERDVRKSED